MRAATWLLADVLDDVRSDVLGEERDVDLNDVAAGDGVLFVRNAVGLAGRGVAARVDADGAVAALAAVAHDDHTRMRGGTGDGIDADTDGSVRPVAIGAIPFLPGASAELIVPRLVVRKHATRPATVTVVGDDRDDLSIDSARALLRAPAPSPVGAASYTIEPGVPVDHYLDAVRAARDAVRAGTLTKAVIARPIVVESSEPIDVHAVLRRLKASFGSSYRYSIEGFIGASPELLVEVDGIHVRSHPLAGTAARTGDAEHDAAAAAALIASTKNQVEHRVVIDVVHDTLLPWASYLDWEPEPSIVTVANVQHLGTRMEGVLSQPGPSAIQLVRALTPTPAVGGHPRDVAIALITAVEGYERGRYAGAVGWVDAAGDGTWAVALRCAELSDDRHRARLVAGGGIVADSDPHAELAETQAKFQAMLSAIVRP